MFRTTSDYPHRPVFYRIVQVDVNGKLVEKTFSSSEWLKYIRPNQKVRHVFTGVHEMGGHVPGQCLECNFSLFQFVDGEEYCTQCNSIFTEAIAEEASLDKTAIATEKWYLAKQQRLSSKDDYQKVYQEIIRMAEEKKQQEEKEYEQYKYKSPLIYAPDQVSPNSAQKSALSLGDWDGQDDNGTMLVRTKPQSVRQGNRSLPKKP